MKKKRPQNQKHATQKVWPYYAAGIAALILLPRLGFGLIKLILKLLPLIAGLLLVKVILDREKQKEKDKPEEPVVHYEVPPRQTASGCTGTYAPPRPQQEPEPNTGNPELDELIRRGRKSMKRIHEIDEDIPDYKISAQLKQIEILTGSILDQVQQRQDKLRQVRQFMNYYMDTTIKLLERYVQMQNIGLQGENITKAMTEIEQMLDKVVVAFQKELDNMFAMDVVDITADIQVMEHMMATQGLTDHKDF